MIIKKFQGKTKEEALESAKRELGDGLVEMNVRIIKAKGFLGMFQGNKIEVTVAKEEENEKYMAEEQSGEIQRDGVAMSLSQAGALKPQQERKKSVSKESDAASVAVADILSAFPQIKEQPEAKPVFAHAGKESREDSKTNELEEKLENLQNLIERQLSRQEHKTQSDEAKTEEAGKRAENKERINFLRLLYNKMIDNEINERYANEIIDTLWRKMSSAHAFSFS